MADPLRALPTDPEARAILRALVLAVRLTPTREPLERAGDLLRLGLVADDGGLVSVTAKGARAAARVPCHVAWLAAGPPREPWATRAVSVREGRAVADWQRGYLVALGHVARRWGVEVPAGPWWVSP